MNTPTKVIGTATFIMLIVSIVATIALINLPPYTTQTTYTVAILSTGSSIITTVMLAIATYGQYQMSKE